MPTPGPPAAVTFPPVRRDRLANGLSVWAIRSEAAPLASVALVLDRGSADDPAHRPGLAGLTADTMDEGAGSYDAIALADAFTRLGTYLEVEVGTDVTLFGFTALSRHFEAALMLLADVVRRPRLDAPGFQRVRELRLNRLRQLSRAPASIAERVFANAVFADHPYGHPALGTSRALEAVSLDEARAFWERRLTPYGATLIVAGQVPPDAVLRWADAALGGWETHGAVETGGAPLPEVRPDAVVRLVDRPGAPQSELRVGHAGPPRRTEAYHALVTLNAVLGGQFSSRLNRNLRERRGVTYGARTSFDFRRAGGQFSADTSVDAAATAESVGEILRELDEIRRADVLERGELARAQSSLTRGYVRGFETAGQLTRAAAHLVTHGLEPDVFEEFVPRVESVSERDVQEAASRFIHPDACAIVVVGDAARCLTPLEALGRPVVSATPEF
jgi:zinc protease